MYQEAEQPEAAEDSYRNSLAIRVRLGDVAGQAATLNQLGNLYDDVLNRPEEAVAFYRQAAGKYVEMGDSANEGVTRSDTLRKLRRFDEVRQEIRRAIECKSQFGDATEPWKSWDILAKIETNPTAAAEAKRKAIECYLAYRRDGGENHASDGRISLAVTARLLAGDPAGAASLLQQVAVDPKAAWLRPFIQALLTIVGGSRDRTLADAPDLKSSSCSTSWRKPGSNDPRKVVLTSEKPARLSGHARVQAARRGTTGKSRRRSARRYGLPLTAGGSSAGGIFPSAATGTENITRPDRSVRSSSRKQRRSW